MARRRSPAPASADLDVLEVAPPKPYGRLERVQISGLLGESDHDFALEHEYPTILTGANGTGKSTVLKTINAVGTASWKDLLDLPFESIALHFEDAQPLRVTKTSDGLEIASGRRKPFLLTAFDPERTRYFSQRVVSHLVDPPWGHGRFEFEDPDEIPRTVLMRLPPVERRQIERYREASAQWWDHLREASPDWLQEVPGRFPVRFITEQRLIIHQTDPRGLDPRYRGREAAEERIAEAVSQYSADLGRLMARELRRYAVASQREDRFFPRRVVQAMGEQEHVEEAELKELLERVADRRRALEDVGLVEEEVGAGFDERSLENEQVRHVIRTHAEATLRKFDELEDLRTKLELFTTFLHEHFAGKQARTRAEGTGPDEGLTFVLANGESLRPSRLSSGEQQMLVLAYQLLFETEEGMLLLIDEPEISLHVGWQRSFVDDITAMGRPHRINYLLATHSPTLIGGREELKRSLDRPRK
jgi:energy-coupling factor transporter ATP-binding protein EcfA2